MAGKHTVRARPADRQARALEVPHADLEHGIVGAVVNRQVTVDLIDLDVTNHVRAGHGKHLLILGEVLVGEREAVRFL